MQDHEFDNYMIRVTEQELNDINNAIQTKTPLHGVEDFRWLQGRRAVVMELIERLKNGEQERNSAVKNDQYYEKRLAARNHILCLEDKVKEQDSFTIENTIPIMEYIECGVIDAEILDRIFTGREKALMARYNERMLERVLIEECIHGTEKKED